MSVLDGSKMEFGCWYSGNSPCQLQVTINLQSSNLCLLVVCPIITHEPLDRFSSNFDQGKEPGESSKLGFVLGIIYNAIIMELHASKIHLHWKHQLRLFSPGPIYKNNLFHL